MFVIFLSESEGIINNLRLHGVCIVELFFWFAIVLTFQLIEDFRAGSNVSNDFNIMFKLVVKITIFSKVKSFLLEELEPVRINLLLSGHDVILIYNLGLGIDEDFRAIAFLF